LPYITVEEAARNMNLSERSVRNYCAGERIPGAVMIGKTWYIPEDTVKPDRLNRHTEPAMTLLNVLAAEKAARISGGIYHRIQIDLTYNSNHIEGSRLTHEQTRLIYDTNTIEPCGGILKVDDIVETANHFRCVNMIIANAAYPLNETFIKRLHLTLKNGTGDSRLDWFEVGAYKKLPNEVGGIETTLPENVESEMKTLLSAYNRTGKKTLDELLDFHCRFERIHPFQDGNGRIGRLILFKECLRNGIVPFIIGDDIKAYYYRGLREWETEPGYLRDTCLSAQDNFTKVLQYFRIE